MKKVDEGGLAEFLDKRQERTTDHQKVFLGGTVTAVRGVAGAQEVQVRRTGEPASNGAWHQVLPGVVPQLGDQGDLMWRDNQQAYLVNLMGTAREIDQHSYRVRLYFNGGTPAILAGWTFVGCNAVDYDPGGMAQGTATIRIPLPGQYLIIGCASISQNLPIVAGIYLNGSEKRIGTYESGVPSTSQVVATLPLVAGDLLTLWLYSPNNANLSGTDDHRCFLSADLLNAF